MLPNNCIILVNILKRTFLFCVMICLLLYSCIGHKDIASISSTPISTEIQPVQSAAISTNTPFAMYPGKKAILHYFVAGNQADFDPFFDPPSGNILTKLVLYDDGQLLIAGPGETYQQKLLSPGEINALLSSMDSLGFFILASNQKHDPTDLLYDFGDDYVRSFDGLRDCIFVDTDRQRELCVNEAYIQFLKPGMANFLKYLDGYAPSDMTPFQPDRILLTIQQDPDPNANNPTATPWSEDFPSLEYDPGRFTSDTSNQVVFIDGELAGDIFLLFADGDGQKVVTQYGKEYVISLRVLLPHEKVKNPQ